MTGDGRDGTGFTLVEIMIVVTIIAILAAMAVPNVLRGRASSNEAATIGNLRTLHNSLQMYDSSNSTYPDAWQDDMYTNATPDYGPSSFNAAMNGSTVQGYTYTYTPLPAGCAGTGANPCSDYTVIANPQNPGATGTRAFFLDGTGNIRHETGAGSATSGCPTIDQPPGTDC